MSVIDFKQLFQPSDFKNCKIVIAAVSGGGDSTSLLFLLRDYLKQLEDAPELLAVTVDHRLRPESAAEAEEVARLCKRLDVRHETVCWADAKPQTALSHEARIARYGLLFSEAEKVGASVIMTGHTLNDQAETYEMRLHRGSRRGLACMPRESLLMRKIRLIRPLLGVKREQLREYLRSIKQDWIDDPTNENPHYERVRIRQRLKDEDVDIIAKKVEEAAIFRRDENKAAVELIAKLDMKMQHALCTISNVSDEQLNDPQFPFVMGVLASIIGGSQALASDSQVDFLKKQLVKKRTSLYHFTLLGTVIEINGKTIRLWREARNQTASVAGPQSSIIWDGRYRVDNRSNNAVRVNVPSVCDIKAVAEEQNISSRSIHFLSLQTALAIFSRSGIDIPALTGKLVHAENLTCKRFMRPFGWLISSDDYSLFNILSPFFEMTLSTSREND